MYQLQSVMAVHIVPFVMLHILLRGSTYIKTTGFYCYFSSSPIFPVLINIIIITIFIAIFILSLSFLVVVASSIDLLIIIFICYYYYHHCFYYYYSHCNYNYPCHIIIIIIVDVVNHSMPNSNAYLFISSFKYDVYFPTNQVAIPERIYDCKDVTS